MEKKLIISVFQMRKMSLGVFKHVASGYRADKRQGWDLNPPSSVPADCFINHYTTKVMPCYKYLQVLNETGVRGQVGGDLETQNSLSAYHLISSSLVSCYLHFYNLPTPPPSTSRSTNSSFLGSLVKAEKTALVFLFSSHRPASESIVIIPKVQLWVNGYNPQGAIQVIMKHHYKSNLTSQSLQHLHWKIELWFFHLQNQSVH